MNVSKAKPANGINDMDETDVCSCTHVMYQVNINNTTQGLGLLLDQSVAVTIDARSHLTKTSDKICFQPVLTCDFVSTDFCCCC